MARPDLNMLFTAKTYRDILQQLIDPSHSEACEAHLGLARICYEWNALEAAESHAPRSSKLAEPMASGAGLSADAMAARVLQVRNRFTEARAMAAQGDMALALPLLRSYRAQMDEAGRADESLKALVAEAMALHSAGQLDDALRILREALLLGEPGDFIRTFVDEGQAMATLLAALADRGTLPDYTAQLLAVWGSTKASGVDFAHLQRLGVEPLSERELDILRLIQQGQSNQGIGETLFLSLHTVKWHNQNIFDKLQVKRRTEAVARARALKLLTA